MLKDWPLIQAEDMVRTRLNPNTIRGVSLAEWNAQGPIVRISLDNGAMIQALLLEPADWFVHD